MNNHTKASMVVVGFLLALAASTASAQNNFRSLQSLYVVDANGKVVGRVLGFAGQDPIFNVVAFSVGKNVITLGVVTNEFVGPEGGLFFTSFDCSGAPLFTATLPLTGYPLPDTAARTTVLNGKVFSPASNTPQTVNINSFLANVNSPGNAECFQSSFTQDVLPSQLLIDLGGKYSAPFKVVGTPGQDEGD